eukprot:c27164_g1_i2 orf=70-744(+)
MASWRSYGRCTRLICLHTTHCYCPSRSSSTIPYISSPPPLLPQRRVVVTGLGLVTPLGCGVETTWQALLAMKSGVRALRAEDLKISGLEDGALQQTLEQMPSKVVAAVTHGSSAGDFDAAKWLQDKDSKCVAPFIAYALCAAEEALRDANWFPEDPVECQRTGVAVGGGIGCISDIMEAAGLVLQQRIRRLSPFFVPRILINMAAGHVSIKYGFMSLCSAMFSS